MKINSSLTKSSILTLLFIISNGLPFPSPPPGIPLRMPCNAPGLAGHRLTRIVKNALCKSHDLCLSVFTLIFLSSFSFFLSVYSLCLGVYLFSVFYLVRLSSPNPQFALLSPPSCAASSFSGLCKILFSSPCRSRSSSVDGDQFDLPLPLAFLLVCLSFRFFFSVFAARSRSCHSCRCLSPSSERDYFSFFYKWYIVNNAVGKMFYNCLDYYDIQIESFTLP